MSAVGQRRFRGQSAVLALANLEGPDANHAIGVLVRPSGKPVNLRDFALPAVDQFTGFSVPTIAVVGTAMDSGKTQSAAFLVRA